MIRSVNSSYSFAETMKEFHLEEASAKTDGFGIKVNATNVESAFKFLLQIQKRLSKYKATAKINKNLFIMQREYTAITRTHKEFNVQVR